MKVFQLSRGWAVLEAVHADGSETEDGIALHAPFLAFYGDWTEAPIIDAGFYYHELDGETSQAQTYSNSAIVSSLEGYTRLFSKLVVKVWARGTEVSVIVTTDSPPALV